MPASTDVLLVLRAEVDGRVVLNLTTTASMTLAKRLLHGALGAACLTLGACSSSSAVAVAVTAALQDLDRDPDGRQTVVTFDSEPSAILSPANFETTGAQIALDVELSGGDAVVTWDERVTPTDQLRVVGVTGIGEGLVPVTSSDSAPPTFAVVDADQNPGLGGDTFRVVFGGARVVGEDVVNLANWDVRVQAVALDLAGSVFSWNEATQTLDVTLGIFANLHADFTVAASGVRSVADTLVGGANVPGTATGDSQNPTLVSAAQNLDEDEFGRVVDFTFDEAMDPVFSTAVTNFAAGFPTFATDVRLADEDLLRVTFSAPVVPGVNTITLLDVVDAHGNPAADGAVAIASPNPVVNDFASDPELRTVENAGGDLVEVFFVQALDPVDAGDDSHWTLEVDGNPVDLSTQTLSYDLLTKTLTVDLTDDHTTGDAFEFGAAVGDPPLDVDGQAFTEVFVGVIGGDATGPTVVSATQNRTDDDDGLVLDLLFSEDLDAALAEDEANYTVAGLTVDTATLVGGGSLVRLDLSGAIVPGDDTIDITAVGDLAGNAMADATGVVVVSSDVTPPLPSEHVAQAIQGADNDTVEVSFSDKMIAAEVEDVDNWTIESPVGNALDTSGATVSYDAGTNHATLTFDGGDDINFHGGDDFLLQLDAMRDLGGNTVDPGAMTGAIVAEDTYPFVESVWVVTGSTETVHVRFNEAVDLVDDLFDAGTNPTGKTVYDVYTNLAVLKGSATSAVLSADGRGAVVTFPFGVIAGSDTINVRGVTDLARNQMYPIVDAAVDTEDADEPLLDTGVSVLTAVSGENNDTLTAVFAEPVSEFGLTDPANWSVTGTTVIDLDQATFTVLSSTSVQIDLDRPGAGDLEFNESFTLGVDNLFSAQGIEMTAQDTEAILVVGDTTAPDFTAARIDAADASSLVVELDEAINVTDAEDETMLDILGVNPTSAVRLGPRTLRATFAAAPSPGDTLNFTAVRDLAGNTGTIALAVTAAASNGPVPILAEGTAVAGTGGDFVTIVFDEPVEPVTALSSANYTVNNGTPLDLSGASLSFDSTLPAVTIQLADGVEIDVNDAFSVDVDAVANHDGFAIAAPVNVGGAIVGDATAPAAQDSYVNFRASVNGREIDLMFSEDVTDSVALDTASWTSSGGQGVNTATRIRADVVRLRLSSPLLAGETLSITGVQDLAGNTSGALVFTPTL